MARNTEEVAVELSDGSIVHIEATMLGGEEDVAAFDNLSFTEVKAVLESISTDILGALRNAKPRKATVEFGLEIAVEAGKLTALLVKGSGTASLKIALEWGE